MRVRGIVAAVAACGALMPAAASGQGYLDISSGGEPAPHVCHGGSACTLQYAPLVLASDDRVDVIGPFDVTVRISRGLAVSPVGDPCRMSQRQPGLIPEYRLWSCPVPSGSRGSRRLSVTFDGGGGYSDVWHFDTLVVGRGHRATDRLAKVRFRLAGRHLRMQLPLPYGSADARRELWGKRLRAVCVSRDWRPRRPFRHARIAQLTWPARQAGVSVRFERSLGGPPRWCLVEGRKTGGDVAFVRFPRR